MAGSLPVPTDADPRSVLDRQAQLMLNLAEEVLAGVTLETCLWTFDDSSWTVHERNGRWYGELGDESPEMPMPSLAWTMWHPMWWLETLLAHCEDTVPPAPHDVEWPGPGETVPELRRLWARWTAFVNGLDEHAFEAGRAIGFPYDDERPAIHVAGWASMELTKNLAEMCTQRRAADHVLED